MEYIWTCGSGDIAFCSTNYMNKVIDRIKQEPDKMFHIQSKNPKVFDKYKWPKNVALGVTIETDDDDLYQKHNISKAPLPSVRYKDFLNVKHKHKMFCIEPIIDFGEDLIKWIEDIDPVLVWLGYDSKNIGLPEPSKTKFWKLYEDLGKLHIPVIVKTIRS